MHNDIDAGEEVQVLENQKSPKDYFKTGLIVLMILIVIGVPIACVIPGSPVLPMLLGALRWIQHQPLWIKGALVVLIFSVGIPIGLPATPLELCTGFLFGFWVGSFFAGIGITIGNTICYFWGKLLLLEWSEKQQKEKKLVRAICYVVRKEGLKLIVLCRLSPVLPTFMMNYLFATTGMSYGIYLLGSILGDMPWVLCYCYIGSVSKSLTDAFSSGGGGDTMQYVLLAVGIIGTIVLLVVVTYIGKKEIQKAMDEMDESSSEYLPLKNSDVTKYASNEPLLRDESSIKHSYKSWDSHPSSNANSSNFSPNNNIINNYNDQNTDNSNDNENEINSSFKHPTPFASSTPLSSPPFSNSVPFPSSPFYGSTPLPSNDIPPPFASSVPFSSSPFSSSLPLSPHNNNNDDQSSNQNNVNDAL